MANILMIYATTDGHTRKICLRLQSVIERLQHRVTLSSIDDAAQLDLSGFDKIIIGASIRYGYHSPLIVDFINRNVALLDSKPNAFFSVNVVARKPGKNRPETNPYMQKFLRQINLRPKQMAVFAGKLDYPRYRFFDRLIIRLIMWMTHGPTDPKSITEFTDWQSVEDFGRFISPEPGEFPIMTIG
jgi:menaquinone-dependent protoporphyrinogen oxidase